MLITSSSTCKSHLLNKLDNDDNDQHDIDENDVGGDNENDNGGAPLLVMPAKPKLSLMLSSSQWSAGCYNHCTLLQ